MKETVKIEKISDGYILIDADGNGMSIGSKDAKRLYNFIHDEVQIENMYRSVKEYVEGSEADLTDEEIKDIARNIEDEILRDELYWEVEDRNILYLINKKVLDKNVSED